ncbi:MAG: hypothetical protein JW891_08555 [Candidatus Lokiarchaeota archaeon]|nr:hypothetical protein [Candidatus Lokiarchaeota archaeon]
MSKKDENEGIFQENNEIQTRSSNPLNNISLFIEPLDKTTVKLIKLGRVNDLQNARERAILLEDEASWDLEEALSILDVHDGRILVNRTLKDARFKMVKTYLLAAFRDWLYDYNSGKDSPKNIEVVTTNIRLQEVIKKASFRQIAGMMWSALALAIQKMDVLSSPPL